MLSLIILLVFKTQQESQQTTVREMRENAEFE